VNPQDSNLGLQEEEMMEDFRRLRKINRLSNVPFFEAWTILETLRSNGRQHLDYLLRAGRSLHYAVSLHSLVLFNCGRHWHGSGLLLCSLVNDIQILPT